MAALRGWLTAVTAVTLLLAAAEALLPQGTLRRLASFTGGLILLVTLLRPLLGADLGRLDLGGYNDAVEERRAELEAAGREELAKRIETGTAAYISDKADALGLRITVRVRTRDSGDGVPVPWTAELTGPRSEALASYMETELGIPRGRQVWHEVET